MRPSRTTRMKIEHLAVDSNAPCAIMQNMNTKRGGRFIDRTGKIYGELTVVSVTRKNSRNQYFWKCLCSCGKTCEVFSGNLNSGHTISCGCKKGKWKHGEGGSINFVNRSPEYQTMCSMLQRCFNPRAKSYKYYGGRGITVCKEWNSLEKFPAFLKSVGRRPSRKHSLDRWPDKNGNYEPGNVRWATAKEQNSNTRRNIMLKFRGDHLCRKHMAEKHGMTVSCLIKRLASGMSVEDALTTPVNKKMWNTKRIKCTY